jgi:hypothetical protein
MTIRNHVLTQNFGYHFLIPSIKATTRSYSLLPTRINRSERMEPIFLHRISDSAKKVSRITLKRTYEWVSDMGFQDI